MQKSEAKGKSRFKKISLKLGIVGGGKACKFFLEMLNKESLPYLDIQLVGVCDINPDAEGFRLARKLGIFTTKDFKELFKISDLDGIIELTNSRDVLLELIRHRPKQVGILEHNISRLVRHLYLVDQRLKSAEHQAVIEKMVADFLIQQARQSIMVLNPDFTIADINEACLEFIGKSKSEVIGSPCYKMIYGLDIPCSSSRTGFECPMLETLRTGESAHVIHENPDTTNQTRYCNIVTYPVKNAHGKVVRVIEIWRDITKALTERWSQHIEALKSDLSQLVQEDRMISLGKLVASCVHEINNPIQGLLTFSYLSREILEETSITPQQKQKLKEHADIICKELERCGQIVSGLLSFSRETNRAYKIIDLNDILQSVVVLTRHKAELQGISLQLALSAEPLMIQGDGNLLQQCFLNLIFNALEAMGTQGTLGVTTYREEIGSVGHVIVTDTGCGIPEEALGHIFEPFYTTKEAGAGTGLGLSIVYGAVKNHHGNIEVQSQVNAGTTFSLSFPLNPNGAALV